MQQDFDPRLPALTETGNLKSRLALLFILLGIGGICLLFLIPQKAEKPALKRLEWNDLELSGSFQDRKLILAGISKSLQILKGPKGAGTLSISGVPVSRKALCLSLERLEALFSGADSSTDLLHKLEKEFVPYEIQGGTRHGDVPVLATGYFQPRLKGSYNATKEYGFPVYAWPPDLVKVNLEHFGKGLPAKTLWGRVSGRRLVPYYSRKEIEEIRPLAKGLALCWLASPVDVLELQIQGSGIITLPDGSSRFIHYAASNGWEYRSIGKVLREQGALPPENLDWQAIRKWAESHPGKFRRFLFENPRYIFFKWEEKGPVGCYGQILVPGTSVALDPSVYPPGMPGLLLTAWPSIKKGPEWLRGRPEMLLIANHDRGGAIKGPYRLDLYCGSGEDAGKLAGRLKNRARLIILLLKGTKMKDRA